ncbi:MAG: enoyl-CoA hydratase, partial [SAR202 cluster bacterium]
MPIKFEKKNHIAYITINNPDKANIMDRDTNNELDAAWREIWEDLDVRA